MTNPQKQPALHVTQKDLIEQLRREVEHLRREVSELQEDKRSLRSDLEHLKKTNLRLEVERAELLMALLNRRPKNEPSNNLESQQDDPTQAESHPGPSAPVGRLFPIATENRRGDPHGCVDEVAEDVIKGRSESLVRNRHCFRPSRKKLTI
jgi:hypothetical protein